MNARLRKVHRTAAAGLAVVCPAILGAALWARPAEIAPTGAAELADKAAAPTLTWQRVDAGRDGVVLDLAVEGVDSRPDLLCYWSPAAGPADLDEAFLLCSVAVGHPARVMLPDIAARSAGRLLLYSLAHGDVVVEEPVPSFEGVPR